MTHFSFYKKCFHTLVFIVYVCVGIYSVTIIIIHEDDLRRHPLLDYALKYINMYFSFWNLGLNVIYFGIHFALDIIDVFSKKRKSLAQIENYLNKIAGILLFSITFPFSLVISIEFWVIFLWDRELIYPAFLETILPNAANHLVHTTLFPLSILYMLTSSGEVPSMKVALSGQCFIITIYSAAFLNHYLNVGQYPYLSLEALTPIQQFCCLIFSSVGPIICLLLGYKLNEYFIHLKKTYGLIL